MLRSFLDGMKWREYARVFQREGADRDGEYFPSLQFTRTETSARRHLQPQPQCTPDRVRAPQFFAAASSPTRSPIPYGDDQLYDLKLKVSSPFDAPTLKLMDVSLCARVKEVAAATEARSRGGDERRCVWGVEVCGWMEGSSYYWVRRREAALLLDEGEDAGWREMRLIGKGDAVGLLLDKREEGRTRNSQGREVRQTTSKEEGGSQIGGCRRCREGRRMWISEVGCGLARRS